MSALSASLPSIISSLIGSLAPPHISGGASPMGNQFASMFNQANAGNAARGGDILRLLETQGQSQLADNQTNYQDQLGQIRQSMMDKGLANTTVGDNLNQGAANQLARNNQSVNEHTAQDIASVANSFTQQAPNLGLLSQLLAGGGGGRPGGVSGQIIGAPMPFQFAPVGLLQQDVANRPL